MQTMKDLPYPNSGTIDHILEKDLSLNQWAINKGVKVKLTQTRNFGYLVLPADCKDSRGYVIPKRIFRY